MPSAEQKLLEVALQQGGAFSRHQAKEFGVSRSTVDRRLRSGQWRRGPGAVLALAASPQSWNHRVHAALLAGGVGAAISRYTALSLLGLRVFADAPVDVLVPHPRHLVAEGIRFHSATDLAQHETILVKGVVATLPERSILDLSGIYTPARLGLVFDEAIAAGVTELKDVTSCLLRHMRPGKRGLWRLGEVLDERGPGELTPQSTLEALFLGALREFDVPAPRTQIPHPSPAREGNIVDCGWADERFIAEIDGRRWHSRIQDRTRDADRDRAAAVEGWLTLRIPEEHLLNDRRGVAMDVLRILEQRRSQLGNSR